jgi:MFS family permease
VSNGQPRSAVSDAPLRADAEFRLYWLARALSTAGSVVTLVALPVLVYRMTGSSLITAVTSASEAAPYVIFGLVAGALSDRWDRKRVMVSADVISAVLIATIPVAYWLGVLTIPHVLIVAFAVQAVAVFFDGSNFAALPMLVGSRRIASANAAISGTTTVAQTVLPSVVGVSLAVVQPASLLVVNALTFAASAAYVRSIRRPLHDPQRARTPLTWTVLFRDIAEGVRFLRAHREVRTLTIISALQCVSTGGFIALMVIWCDRVLHVGTGGWRFGLVYSAWGIGGLLGAVSLAWLLRRTDAPSIALRALPFSAALGIATSLVSWWPAAVAGLLAWGAAYTLVWVNIVSYRQQVTPEPLLGRVNTSSRMFAWGIGYTGGAMISGALSQVIGLQAAMTAMTLVTVIAVVMGWRQRPRVTFAREHVTLLSPDLPLKEETCAGSRLTI